MFFRILFLVLHGTMIHNGFIKCRNTREHAMNIERIKELVSQGTPVYWKNVGYQVVKDKLGQYFIKCLRNDYCTGLGTQSGELLENEADFFVMPQTGSTSFRFMVSRVDGDLIDKDLALSVDLNAYAVKAMYNGALRGETSGSHDATINAVEYRFQWDNTTRVMG